MSSSVLHQDSLFFVFKVHGHDIADAKGRHHLPWTGTGHPANRAVLTGRLRD